MINLPGGWPDSPHVTPDGRHLLFSYTPWNLGAITNLRAAPVRAATHPGHHDNPASNPWEDADCCMVSWLGDRWGLPRALEFCDPYSDTSPMRFGNTVLFAKTAPPGSANLDLFMSGYNVVRKWSKPLRLPFCQAGCRDDNPHTIGDGRIWFTSDRSGASRIYVVYSGPAGWLNPQMLGPSVNGGGAIDQFWVAPDGAGAFFQRDGQIFRVARAGGDWGPSRHVDLGLPLVGEPSIGGGQLYFVSVDTGTWVIRVMVADADGDRWVKARSVDER